MENEALLRKLRSIEILKQNGIPFIEHLPNIETKDEVKIRSKDKIAMRAIACLVSIQLACDMMNDINDSKQPAKELLRKYNVQDCLTPNEIQLFDGNTDKQAILNIIWKYEAYWVLLWALGTVDTLPYPSQICDCKLAINKVFDFDSYDDFINTSNLRSVDKLLDEADLIYRYDWACVEARVNNTLVPISLDGSVVLERHRVLNWLINSDYDWDNVPTDT